MEKSKKVSFLYDNILPFKITPEVIPYGVMIAFYKAGQVNTIKYKVNMRWIEKDNISYLVVIDRTTGVYMDDEEPDLMVYKLAEEVALTLYPMVLLINDLGEISSIRNFPEIKKRWNEKQDKLREFYTGDYLEKYLSLNEQAFQNERTLFESIRKDWFLQSYFNSLYRAYTSALQIERTVSFPMLLYADGVNYRITQQINKYLDENNLINIEMTGDFADERSKNDLENELNYSLSEESEKADGSYYANYYLDAKYHSIHSFMLNCSLGLETDRKMSIVVTRMQHINQNKKI